MVRVCQEINNWAKTISQKKMDFQVWPIYYEGNVIVSYMPIFGFTICNDLELKM